MPPDCAWSRCEVVLNDEVIQTRMKKRTEGVFKQYINNNTCDSSSDRSGTDCGGSSGPCAKHRKECITEQDHL